MPDDMKQSARLAALREAIEMLDGMEVDEHRPKPPMSAPSSGLPPEMGAEGAEPDGDESEPDFGSEPLPEGEDLESLKAKLMELCK